MKVFVALLFHVLAKTDSRAAGLHVGEAPFLVGLSGRRPVAAGVLGHAALDGIIRRLLSDAKRRKLQATGRVEDERPAHFDIPGQQFTVVAVQRADDDVWVEIHRERVSADGDELAEVLGPLVAAGHARLRKKEPDLPASDELWTSAARKRA